MVWRFVQRVSGWMDRRSARKRRGRALARPPRGNHARLACLPLEDRVLLTGSVQSTLMPNGILEIQALSGDPAITISNSPEGGTQVRVAGDSGTFTSVNGVSFIDYDMTDVHSILVHLNGGTDSVKVLNLPLALSANLTVDSGTGSDTFMVQNITANQVNFLGAATAGDDTVSLTNVHAGLADIQTGAGSDTITLNSVNLGTGFINTGGGFVDTVTVLGNSTIGDFSAILGSANSAITVSSTQMTLLAITEFNSGSVILNNGDSVAGNASIFVGNDSPQVTLTSLTVGGDLSLSVGGEAEMVSLANVDVRGSLAVSIGSGEEINLQSVSAVGNLSLSVTVFSADEFGDLLQVNATGVSAGGALTMDLGIFGGDFTLTAQTLQAGTDVNIYAGRLSPFVDTHNITLSGVTAGRDFNLSTADSFNTIHISSLTAGQNFNLTTDDGPDNIFLTNLRVGLDFYLNTDYDNDPVEHTSPTTLTVNNLAVGRNLNASTGTPGLGATVGDSITLTNITVGQDFNLQTGDGGDTVMLFQISVHRQLTATLGTGTNGLSAGNVTCAFGTIDGGNNPQSVYQNLGGNSGFDAINFGSFI